MAGYHALLDPSLHTFEYIRTKSVFLLSVVLQTTANRSPHLPNGGTSQVAQRLHNHIKTNVWPLLLLGNMRSIEICQGCMIWATFTASTDIAEDSSGWYLYGHACEPCRSRAPDVTWSDLLEVRMAIELGLSRRFKDNAGFDNGAESTIRNAHRCWFTCFLADRSWAAQTGRPPLVHDRDLIMGARRWLDSPSALPDDASIVALANLRSIFERLPTLELYGRTIERQLDALLNDLESWSVEWVHERWNGMLGEFPPFILH